MTTQSIWREKTPALHECFAVPRDVIKNDIRRPQTKRIIQPRDFKMYPATDAKALFTFAKQLPEEACALRFVVNKNSELWFALEGRPSRNIPVHCQMIAEDPQNAFCKAAGTVYFNQ